MMGDAMPTLMHADAPVAFGMHVAKFAWVDLDLVGVARAKLAIAGEKGSDLILSRLEADALGIWFAAQATALRNCLPGPRLPVFPIDPKALEAAEKQGAIVSPLSGAGAIGLDPDGPIRGMSDATSRSLIMCCRGAIRELGPGGGGVAVGGAAPEPPAPPPGIDPKTIDPTLPTSAKSAYAFGGSKGYADGYGGAPYQPAASAPIGMAGELRAQWEAGYTNGYKMGSTDRAAGKLPAPPVVIGGGGAGFAGVPLVVGAIAGAVVLVGGAIYLGVQYGKNAEAAKAEAVKYKSAAIMHATDRAAELSLDRFRIYEKTGKLPDASPLEKGAADGVANLGKAETSHAWGSALLGVGLGVGGVLAGKWIADRVLG